MSEAIWLPLPGGPTEKGSVVQWLKQPGEPVRRGEPLAILLFDKAEMELSSPADGVLAEVCVQPGQECEVGGLLGRIEREPAAAAESGVAEAARAGRLSLEEMRGGTFTVTNLGTYGVEQFNPVLNPPQVAILGVGALREELALGPDGAVARRKVLRLCLTFDHRAVDGAPAAEALKTCSDLLEAPEALLEGSAPGGAIP